MCAVQCGQRSCLHRNEAEGEMKRSAAGNSPKILDAKVTHRNFGFKQLVDLTDHSEFSGSLGYDGCDAATKLGV